MTKSRTLNHKRVDRIEGNLLVEYPRKSRKSESATNTLNKVQTLHKHTHYDAKISQL